MKYRKMKMSRRGRAGRRRSSRKRIAKRMNRKANRIVRGAIAQRIGRRK